MLLQRTSEFLVGLLRANAGLNHYGLGARWGCGVINPGGDVGCALRANAGYESEKKKSKASSHGTSLLLIRT